MVTSTPLRSGFLRTVARVGASWGAAIRRTRDALNDIGNTHWPYGRR